MKTLILPPGYSDRATRPQMAGSALAPGQFWRNLWRKTWIDTDLRAVIQALRDMDGPDGDPRVKAIHGTTAAYITKGGMALFGAENAPRIQREWRAFYRRLRLNSLPKLISDARQFCLQGNLALEVIIDGLDITGLASLPADSIVANVDDRGRIADPASAYFQWQVDTGILQTKFSLGNLLVARLDPANFDDHGAMGRPMLDASRKSWEKLVFSEEKLVQRRASRASLRMVHLLDGATEEQLAAYKSQVTADQYAGTDTDYYMNRKGAVTPVQGDAQLSDIGDIAHLMNVFFAGAPAPAGVFGWGQELSRDVLQELMAMFFTKIDVLQEHLATIYQEAFEIQLALKGIPPLDFDFYVEYIEPRTLTDNQRADLALKHQAIGLPRQTIIRTAGFTPSEIAELAKAEAAAPEAFMPASAITTNSGQVIQPSVKITPRAAGREQSRTDIST